MEWMVEICYKPGFFNAQAHAVQKDIEDLGISGVKKVRTAHLYSIEGNIGEPELKLLCGELLADKITQQFRINRSSFIVHRASANSKTEGSTTRWIIEVWYKKGVTDAVADTVIKGAVDLGIKGIDTVKTGFKYEISGGLSSEQVERICRGLLANKVVQEYKIQ